MLSILINVECVKIDYAMYMYCMPLKNGNNIITVYNIIVMKRAHTPLAIAHNMIMVCMHPECHFTVTGPHCCCAYVWNGWELSYMIIISTSLSEYIPQILKLLLPSTKWSRCGGNYQACRSANWNTFQCVDHTHTGDGRLP